MGNTSMLEKVLLVCNMKAEQLRLVGSTFDSKVAKEEKFDNSEKFA